MSGRLVSIYGSKGGVGKSFIAVNLAVNLHLETREKVLLLDFALPFAVDAAGYLNLGKVSSMENLLPAAKTLNPALLKTFVTRHESGVDALCLATGERELNDAAFSPQNVDAVLRKLLSVYGFVVLDVGVGFSPVLERVLDLSSLILLPTEPSPLAVQHTLGDSVFLRNRNFPQEVVKTVLNNAGKNDSPSRAEIEQLLKRELFAEIPFDPQAASNTRNGQTYPKDHPRHEVTKGFDSLTLKVVRSAAAHTPAPVEDAGEMPVSESSGTVILTEAGETLDDLKMRLHKELLENFDMKYTDVEVENNPERRKELEEDVTRQIIEILDTTTNIRSREMRERLVREVLQDVLGLGPLEDILGDRTVSEIMVNTWDNIFVERRGKLEHVSQKFFSEKHLMRVIERIVAPLGRKIDSSTPMVDARLKDNSRVNAIIPPLAIHGACLTIRKFPMDRLGISDLLNFKTLNKQIAEFIKAAVLSRLNILISGGTGSGKTTLLNILSAYIPEDERIITVEDSAELQLQQPHVITLESRPPNIEGAGEVTIRDLVKNTLRMRPDRIVVGECRSAEALDMLQAMNTGHDGSLTTVHANSAREAISRLETLVMFAGLDLTPRAIKEQIVGAVDLIVQIKRFKDGSRHITQVSEITGMEGDVVTMGDIFEYQQSGVSPDGKVEGTFVSTGYIPRCLKTFEEKGINIPREIFWTAA